MLLVATVLDNAAGVNFINILCANFLNESALRRFSLVTVRLSNFLAKGYWQKSSVKC